MNTVDPANRRLSWAMPLFGYLGVSLLFAWELLWPGRSLYRWDTMLYNWPLLLETREQLLAGHLPFWASSFCCGTPLLSNINAGVLYPVRIVCWLLPLRIGYQLFLFLHVWLGLAAAHLLFRRGMRLAWPAAAVGAMTYGLSGYARAMWDTHNFMALPWIPLGLAAMLESRSFPVRDFLGDRAVRFRMLLNMAATAACWSMLVLCGDFQSACVWGGVALLLALLMPERGRILVTLAAAGALCALLTAPQWICTFFASLESYRAKGLSFAEAAEFSLHPARVLELFVPHLFGTRDAWAGAVLAGAGARKAIPWTTSIHVGRVALLAIVLGLRRCRRAEVKWAAILWIGFLFLSFGRFMPGFERLQSLPLVSSFRYPQKYLLWSTLGAASLAAFGAQGLRALLDRKYRAATRILWSWGFVMIVGGLLATVVLTVISPDGGNAGWLLRRWMGLAVVLAAAGLAATSRGTRSRRAAILPALVMLDLFLPWRLEHPVTSAFDPLEQPIVAQAIRKSQSPQGRFVRDPAVQGVPLRKGASGLSWSENRTLTQTSALDYNSPRVWGLNSAAGFSPLESAPIREYRLANAVPEDGNPAQVARFADFCRLSAVEWILTASDRAARLENLLGAEPAMQWGPNGQTVLLRVPRVAEARCVKLGNLSPAVPAAQVVNVWRRRPGVIRVDLKAGAHGRLTVSESFASGWEAKDELGATLPVGATPEGFLSVTVPARTTQVRLAYVPRGWHLGSLTGLSGLFLLAAMFCASVDPALLGRLWRSRPVAAAVCSLIFLVVGTAARDRWACTFDEGFHLARGLARLRAGDSRLSYLHPPLQNLAGGYFAGLAQGDRLELPDGQGWEAANVAVYATNLAGMNRRIFPDLVRAGRWGSSLLSAVAIGAAVFLAAGLAGPAAGWLAGLGLGLSPSLLAHGNLATTDAGVVAFALLGTLLLWRSLRSERASALWPATAAFALAAVTKYTGLIWLATYALICIPLAALRRRDRRVLRQIPLAPIWLVFLLLLLYGIQPQTVRCETPAWLNGAAFPAGRYIEGLLSQTAHSAEGHRAFFAGERFMRGSWWHTAASIGLKTPPLWLLAGLIGSAAAAFGPRRRWEVTIPWLPALVFTALLVFCNRMVIGVRHALPVVALGTVAAVVMAARLKAAVPRRLLMTVLAISSVWTAAASFPNYISYFPAWAGGVGEGHRWLVDSNYDWGQDLEELEEQWALVTRANGGTPPRLVYFGFVDPLAVYEIPVSEPSLRGFMDRMRRQGESFESWIEALSALDDAAVASISALELNPYGVDFARLRGAAEIGWIGNCFRVTLAEPFVGSDGGAER